MNMKSRKLLLWPVASIVIAAILIKVSGAMNLFYDLRIPLHVGIEAWCVDMMLVLILWANPIGARVAVLLAGLFLPVPCFVWAPPLFRGLLMVVMFVPFVIAAMPVLSP